MAIGLESEKLQVRPMREMDIGAAVELHRKALDYSFNSRLGPRHLSFLYRIMHTDPSSVVAVAYLDQKLVGLASATLDPVRLKKLFLSSMTIGHWITLFVRLLTHPQLLFEWLQNTQHDRPVYWDGNPVNQYLSAIAVEEGYRQAGVGRGLLGALESFFIRQGCRVYRLETRSDNMASRVFYQRQGFREVAQQGRDVVLIKELVRAAS